MSATALSRPPLRVQTLITGLIVVTILALAVAIVGVFAPGPDSAILEPDLYLVLVLITVLMVRRLPVEAGSWLGRRPIRRALVATISLLCLALVALPSSWSGSYLLLFTWLLIVGDLVLGRATGRLATAREEVVDERQAGLRDQAHRAAYGILILATGAVVLGAYLASDGSRRWLADAMSGPPLLAFLELLFCLPALVIAFSEPSRLGEGSPIRSSPSRQAVITLVLLTVVLVTPLGLSTALAWAPLRSTTVVHPIAGSSGERCEYLGAQTTVGMAFEAAALPISAAACWNGSSARELYGFNRSDCHLGYAILVSVPTVTCARYTGPQGTLHFTYSSKVRSTFLPWITRTVTLRVALTRNGHLAQFP